MSSKQQLIDDYLAGLSVLRSAVAGLTRDQLVARPVPGKMSTLEVVCHLADFEPITADRMKRVIAENNPALLGADQDCFLAALAYHDRDLEEELTIIEKTRKQLARILCKLPEQAWQRSGVHNERGPLTLEKLLTGEVNHMNHHVKFIHEKRRALGVA
jgi:hypothetical protein